MVKRQRTNLFRGTLGSLIAGSIALMTAAGPAVGATSIKIGRTNVANVSHLPIYLAMETGLFEQEGLDARFVAMTESALVTAGLAGLIDFVPLPRAGAQAALKGAAVRFVVGQSLFSPSALIAARQITSVAQLKYRILGFGQMGQASYHDGEIILRDRFNLVLGEDYRAIAIPGERNRLAALEKGDIQAGLFSLVYAAKAEARGFKRLLRTGKFLPRVKGAVWTRKNYLKANRDTVRRFIRAVAKATDIIHTDGKTTVAVIQKYLGIYHPEETKALWLSVRDTFTADIPAPLLKNLFADRLRRLQQKGLWPRDRKSPNPEYFIARGLLSKTLNQMAHAFETIDVTNRAR